MRKKRTKPAAAAAACLLALLLALPVAWAAWRLEARKQVQQADIRPNNRYEDTLVVVAGVDYEPYSFLDGESRPSGYDVEIFYALANEMQVNVDLRLMPWDDCMRALAAGEADMMAGLDYRRGREAGLLLSKALHYDRYFCFGREAYHLPSELGGRRLATVRQSGCIAEFLEPGGLVGNTVFYATYTEALQSVIDGENDYAVARYAVGRRILARLGEDEVRPVGPSVGNNAVCIGLGPARAGMLAEVDRAIDALVQDGTLAALSDKWLGDYVDLVQPRDILRAYEGPLIAAALALLALFAGAVFYVYRGRARALAREHEGTLRVLEYEHLITEATKGLYETIYELDLTRDRAAAEGTMRHMEELGFARDAPFSASLRHVAATMLKPEFAKGYLDTFLPQRVLKAFEGGTTSLCYEYMMSRDGGKTYQWVREYARLFYWKPERSVRMILYRQNIDDEKRREHQLLEVAQRDGMTGLLNKSATEALVEKALGEPERPGVAHALLLVDIDDFKHVNDSFGHAFGDRVIREFAAHLMQNTRKTDIAGRVGGDEFLLFLGGVPGEAWLEDKLGQMNASLAQTVDAGGVACKVSASIGAALAPGGGASFAALYRQADEALYQTKARGKNGYTIYREEAPARAVSYLGNRQWAIGNGQ